MDFFLAILFSLIAIGVLFEVLFLIARNKSDRVKRLILIILGIVFATVYIVGIDVYNVFGQTISLVNPVISLSKLGILMLAILRWFTYAGTIMLGIAVFYKKRHFVNMAVLFVLPLALINLVFLKPNLMAISGDNINYASYESIRFMVEIVLSAVICLYLLFVSGNNIVSCRFFKCKNSQIAKDKADAVSVKAELLLTLAWFVFTVLLYVPLWNFQLFFGTTSIKLTLFGRVHKYWIYICFLAPLCFYLALRKKDYDTKYLVLVLLSVQAFFQFFGGMVMSQNNFFQTPINGWPLQICNLAMITIPLSIITKNKPLFFFTLFVNSVAAFAAVVFQDISEDLFLFSYLSLKYIVEHINAFYIPLLALCLGIFRLPKRKDFLYAFIIFSSYFIGALMLNTYAVNIQPDVNYFFMMDDKIASIFGFLRSVRAITYTIDNLFGVPWKFYPFYQFVIYLGVGLMMLIQWGGVVYVTRITDRFYFYIQKRAEEKMNLLNLRKDLCGQPLNTPLNSGAINMLKISDFTKIYSKSNQKAVNNLNLTVHAGEIFGLLGHNGAGKTTTIKACVGILPITEGKIEVFGYNIARQPLEAKLLIGYVPDNHAIYESITGREYINFVADMYDVPKKERDETLDELLKSLNMGHAIDKQIKTYSHGMKQKVTIMAALIHSPRLWVLDEPLTGLDPKSVYEIKECIKRHAANGNIVILSSHLLDVVEKICDRVAVMQHGKLERIIDLKDGALDETLESIYLKVTEVDNQENGANAVKEESES